MDYQGSEEENGRIWAGSGLDVMKNEKVGSV